MGFDEEAVTDEQREACAVVVMRTMLEDWCDDTGVPFDDALDAFASSRTYELLFDFSSRQWAEGPDNLRFVWEQERRNGRWTVPTSTVLTSGCTGIIFLSSVLWMLRIS